jgi:hypothetical protein
MIRVQPAAARKFDLPLFRFPLRGQTGAGGFPPRRKARCAPANSAGSPVLAAPPTRGLRPLVHPLLLSRLPATFFSFAQSIRFADSSPDTAAAK